MRINACKAESATWKGAPLFLKIPTLRKGRILLASSVELPESPGLPSAVLDPEVLLDTLAAGPLPVGTILARENTPCLAVISRHYQPQEGEAHSAFCLSLQAMEDLEAGEYEFIPCHSGPALAWVTVSDKGSVGQRNDESGPAIAHTLSSAMSLRCHNGYVVPDDIHRLRALVTDLALTQGYDLIITTGGTGLTPRDVTPEALLPLLEKRLEGLEQAMLQKSLSITPRGALSRPVCGSIGQSLLITLPGSLKAVRENLESILGALGHGLEKLQGSPSDCGRV